MLAVAPAFRLFPCQLYENDPMTWLAASPGNVKRRGAIVDNVAVLDDGTIFQASVMPAATYHVVNTNDGAALGTVVSSDDSEET